METRENENENGNGNGNENESGNSNGSEPHEAKAWAEAEAEAGTGAGAGAGAMAEAWVPHKAEACNQALHMLPLHKQHRQQQQQYETAQSLRQRQKIYKITMQHAWNCKSFSLFTLWLQSSRRVSEIFAWMSRTCPRPAPHTHPHPQNTRPALKTQAQPEREQDGCQAPTRWACLRLE